MIDKIVRQIKKFDKKNTQLFRVTIVVLVIAVASGATASAHYFSTKTPPSKPVAHIAKPKPVKTATPAPTTSAASTTTPNAQSNAASSSTSSSSTTSKPTAAPTITPVSTPQINCSSFDTSSQAGYQEAVDNLAGGLANDEVDASDTYDNGAVSLASIVAVINSDITSTNTAISNDWTSDFVTNVPAQCAPAPSVTLRQVPACEATYYGGIGTCISQIDPSLGI